MHDALQQLPKYRTNAYLTFCTGDTAWVPVWADLACWSTYLLLELTPLLACADQLRVLKGEPLDLPPDGYPAIVELWATWWVTLVMSHPEPGAYSSPSLTCGHCLRLSCIGRARWDAKYQFQDFPLHVS